MYIEDMYENEYLYFKSLRDFRGKDSDQTGRLDPRELNLKNTQIATLSIKTDTAEIHLHEILEKFNAQHMEYLAESKINCCSLHWLEIEPEQAPSTYDSKLLKMGNKAILIYDLNKFYEILDSALEQLRFEYSRKKVTYYNPKKFNGEINLHHKDEQYKYQNEYRILIYPTDNEPLNLKLVGLKEISTIIDTKDIVNLRIEIIP